LAQIFDVLRHCEEKTMGLRVGFPKPAGEAGNLIKTTEKMRLLWSSLPRNDAIKVDYVLLVSIFTILILTTKLKL
jgi:hypothetical protein